MRAIKWLIGLVGGYAVFVLVFEGVYLGLMQPSFEKAECQGLTQAQRRARGECGIPMIQLSIESPDQTRQTTMLARVEMDDGVYVSAHHWTRGWYHAALAAGEVNGEVDGQLRRYAVQPVVGDEFQRVADRMPLTLPVRVLMGFPPERQILRLDELP